MKPLNIVLAVISGAIAGQFFNFRLLVLRILASTAYTFVLLYAIDSLVVRKAEV